MLHTLDFQTNMILGKSLTHKLFDLKTTEFTLEQNLQDASAYKYFSIIIMKYAD